MNKFTLAFLICVFTCYHAMAQTSTTHRKSSNAYRNNYQRMAIGSLSNSSLEIRADGTLWAWGENRFGTLGDGTNVDRTSPTQVGMDNKWISVSTNETHSLGLKSDGTLWAWGANTYGELGDGTAVSTLAKYNPTQIGTDTKWVSIAAGCDYSVALKSDGTLWAWGINDFGQLGDGTYANKYNPTQIGTDTKWVSIATGRSHSAALKSDGTLWAWGRNDYGELGNGTTIQQIAPYKVVQITNGQLSQQVLIILLP